ncbi:ermin isoform X1 [Peromyscus maniculatus bairdii]|uniref:Ermin n=1 Tax=Peromyscus maniculatus bairdii TaxID=230844 RepID=A0A6I9M9R3_PERMB|nr:ermin isoform X1 [Peromyscus maniculatus bairdii]
MADAPVTLSGTECNGDRPPDNDQQCISQTSKDAADAGGTQTYYSVEPSLEDVPARGSQEESGNSKGSVLPEEPAGEKSLHENSEENLFVVHKAIRDLSLQEASAEDMAFREGHPWKKIPLSSSDLEMNTQKERIAHQPLEHREDDSTTYQAAEIEWLGFRKSTPVDILHSKCDEEPEVWNEEINEEDVDDCNDDEDEVRVIEFKRNHSDGSQLKEENHAREDSPLSSPGSQPGTPDEQPVLGKKGDISRNAYSRYNTISYRKIRKGNTKQRIDEFESMMHL